MSTLRWPSTAAFASRGSTTSASCCRRTSTAPSVTSRSYCRSVRTCGSARAHTWSGPEIAYPEKRDVDAAYVRLVERALWSAGFVGIATHDERMLEHAIAFIGRERIPQERFQFQMLYGVRPQHQLSLVGRGYAVLVATPYGPDWYRYLMRRLAERPANIGFLLRNLVRG